jgi:hypothetical protein
MGEHEDLERRLEGSRDVFMADTIPVDKRDPPRVCHTSVTDGHHQGARHDLPGDRHGSECRAGGVRDLDDALLPLARWREETDEANNCKASSTTVTVMP